MALTLEQLQERFSDPNKNFVIGPDGSRLIIDKEQEEDAFRKGFRIATPEERQNELWHKEFGEGLAAQTASGAAGVLRGVTFGLSDPILAFSAEKIAQGISSVTGLPLREDITAGGILGQLKQQNPSISTGTEIAGAVVPAVLSGGAGAVGSAARGATVAGRVASAGRATETAVAEYILSRGAGKLGASVLKKTAAEVAGGIAGGAVEGAIFGAGNYVSKVALEEEPEFTAEGLIDHLGTGALLGGATSGLLGGARELVPATIRGVGNSFVNAVKNGTDTFAPNLGNKLKDIYSKFASARTGAPADEIRQLFEPPTTADLSEIFPLAEGEAIKRGVGKLTSEQKNTIYDKIYRNYKTFIEGARKESDTAVSSVEELRNIYGAKISPEEIKVLLKKATPQEDLLTAQSGLKITEDYGKELGKLSARLNSRPDIYLAKDFVNNYNQFVYHFNKNLDDYKKIIAQDPAAFSADRIYNFLTQERKILDNIIKYDRDIPVNQLSTIKEIKGARTALKDILIDPSIWGEPITRVRDINEGLNEYLASLSNFKALFGKKLIRPDGSVEYVINPSSLKSFFSNPQSASNAIKKEVLTELNTNAYKLMGVFNKSNLIDTAAPLFGTEMSSSLKEFAKNIDQNNIMLDLIEKDRLFSGIKQQAESAGIVEYLPLAGWISGLFGGGIGLPASVLLRTGKDPAMEIQMMKFIQNTSQKIPNYIGNSIKELGDVTDKVTERVPVVIVKEKQKDKDKPMDYRKYAELAKSLQNNPELLNKNLLYGLSEIEAVSPLIAETMREKLQKMVQFITSKIPKSYSPDPLRPNLLIEPSYYERVKFERYLKAINNPLTVFKDMSRGSVSVEGVEVLKELYPAIYSKFYEISMQHIMEGNMSRSTRIKLQSALGVSSGDINMYQAVYEQQAQKKEKESSNRRMSEGSVKRLTEGETY